MQHVFYQDQVRYTSPDGYQGHVVVAQMRMRKSGLERAGKWQPGDFNLSHYYLAKSKGYCSSKNDINSPGILIDSVKPTSWLQK